MKVPEWLDTLAVVDCAARVLSEHRITPGNDSVEFSSLRSTMRANPVRVLRLAWQTGDRSERQTVAARVLVWLGKDQARVRMVQERVR